jgi:hypothetical protein
MAKKRLPVWSLPDVNKTLDDLVKVLTDNDENQEQVLLDTEHITETVAIVNHSLMQLNFPALSSAEIDVVRTIRSKLNQLSSAYIEHKKQVELAIRSQQNTSKLRKAYG